MTIFGNPRIGFAFRIVLAGVLLYAGLIKLFEPHAARDAILAYRLLPISWAPLLGYALPLAEVLLGLVLLTGFFTRLAALSSSILMLLFIGGIISVWVRGYSIDCGCFGGGGDISPEGRASRYTQEIIRDFGFAGLGFWLVKWPATWLSVDSLTSGHTYLEQETGKEN